LPTYTYTCTSCNDLIEKRQSFHDAPLTTCEQCGGSLRKVFHPVGIVFKGSGWYVTDSRSSSSTAVSGNGTSTSKPAESSDSGSTKPAESSKPAEASSTSTTSTTSASSASSKD
jgi:putative FmdB family regulatory protein